MLLYYSSNYNNRSKFLIPYRACILLVVVLALELELLKVILLELE